LLINQASLVAFMAAGKGKSAILQRVLEGPPDPNEFPAQLIKPAEGRLLWLVDRDASRLLSEKTVSDDQSAPAT
jgi:6-phosphogluconolactonase